MTGVICGFPRGGHFETGGQRHARPDGGLAELLKFLEGVAAASVRATAPRTNRLSVRMAP